MPDDEWSARRRWAAAVVALRGESAEVWAVLEGALAAGRVTLRELMELGFDGEPIAVPLDAPVLVMRRHALPTAEGRLAPDGVMTSRRLANVLPMTTAMTSDLPRAIETARALGVVDVTSLSELRPPPSEITREVGLHQSFAVWTAAASRWTVVREFCEQLAGILAADLRKEVRLVVAHDDTIQAAAVGLLGSAASALGSSLGYLEGVAIALGEGGGAVRLGGAPPF